jgi:hypothetical protein
MAKNLYHSALVKLGQVMVTVKSDVLKSQFPNKPDYVVMEINGEDFNYTTENDACAEFFRGQKGATMALSAEGRKEEAALTYLGDTVDSISHRNLPPKQAAAPAKPAAGGPPQRRQEPPGGQKGAAPPAKAAETGQPVAGNKPPVQGQAANGKPPPQPVKTPAERLAGAKVHANKVANLYLVAHQAAKFARDQIKIQCGDELSAEEFQGMKMNICIQLEKDGHLAGMPTGVLSLAKAAAKPAAPASGPDPDAAAAAEAEARAAERAAGEAAAAAERARVAEAQRLAAERAEEEAAGVPF